MANFRIQTKQTTKFGESIKATTDAIYNTFDDMLLYVLEELDMETIVELNEADVILYRGNMTIVNERDLDVTLTYTLIN